MISYYIGFIGKTKNLILLREFKNLIEENENIKFPGYISNRKLLIEAYDNHNIFHKGILRELSGGEKISLLV